MRPEADSTGAPVAEALMGRGLNAAQRAAMQVAESAREQAGAASFAAGLFMGRFDRGALSPFPRQEDAERRIGDEMVRRVSAFLAERLDADEVDETRTIPESVVEGLRDLGVFRMKVPLAYGGLGYSQVNYNRVLMAIASYCGSTAVLVSAHQSIGVPQPLKMFGTEAQKEKYLRRIAAGELSAFALTEPDVGSDPARMSTTAVLSADGSYYVLNGMKQWTTNGPIADLLVVMARTSDGARGPKITAFIVEAATPGVEVAHRCDFMGLRGIQNGLIRFRDVRVPAENVIWGEGLGLKLALKTLNTGRLTLPAACTGLGKQCLSIARRWGASRVQWGLPIGKHEAGSEKVASIAATTFAMEAVTWLTSHWADEGREIRLEAAMAKLFCSQVSWELIDQTMQLRGGRGYERATSLRERGEDPWPIERMMRDARINTIIEGTSEIMRLFIAREAVDNHLKVAGDLVNPKAPAGKRVAAAARAGLHYAWWFPTRFFGWGFWPRYSQYGPLAKHVRWMDRATRRLARSVFYAMARFGPGLEKKQAVLGRIVEIGAELFAMTAAVVCARRRVREEPSDRTPYTLADVFCRQARRRIEQRFRDLFDNDDSATYKLARGVLEGHYTWLEEGVVSMEKSYGEKPMTPVAVP
jgi:alkylation response protein AidB-like acyl-CoA dehydrogenase